LVQYTDIEASFF